MVDKEQQMIKQIKKKDAIGEKKTKNKQTERLLQHCYWHPFKKKCKKSHFDFKLVGWDCRIHQLHLYRGVRPLNECPGYDAKAFDGEVLVF